MSLQLVLALLTVAGGTSPAVGVRPKRVATEDAVVTLHCRPVHGQSRAEASQLACTVVGEAGARATATVTRTKDSELVDPFASRASSTSTPAPSDPNALVDPFEPIAKR